MPAATAVSVADRPGGFHFQGQFTLDPGSIAAGGREQETVAIPGLAVGDLVIVRNRTARALVPTAERVSSAGNLEFFLENNTAGAVDAGADIYDFYVFRGSTGPLR
jgi:hypothetical protein